MEVVLEAPVEVVKPINEVVLEAPVEVVKPINEVVLETPLEKVVKVLGFRVSVIQFELGIQAKIVVLINCSCGDEKYNEYKEFVIEGEEYTAWGADDKYIVDIVHSKLPQWF
jgi:hypothetical protein